MNYPLASNSMESHTGLNPSSNEDVLVAALSEVIQLARSKGQTLAELQAEVLADDPLLDHHQRLHLSEIVAQAWEMLP